MKLRCEKIGERFLLLLVILFSTISFVFALPSGPESLTDGPSSRFGIPSTKSALALAGNVTQIIANTSTITRTWQGYYGNITGRIVLGNSNNQTLYDWQLTTPQGEIYAVRSPTLPNWASIRCATAEELQAEDLALSVNASIDEDAVNRTFLFTFTHPTFYVGSVQINEDECAGVGLYDNTATPSENFKEVLLSDGTSNLIYTGILSRTMNPFAESIGFDNEPHDFQIIVGEDGHGTNTATSTYYFYLEIE